MRVATVQGLGTALVEVALAQTGRALGPGSEVRLPSGPGARGKGTWRRAGLGAKVRVNNIQFGSSNVIIMKTLIINSRNNNCRVQSFELRF